MTAIRGQTRKAEYRLVNGCLATETCFAFFSYHQISRFAQSMTTATNKREDASLVFMK
jgi:hypothetical protein